MLPSVAQFLRSNLGLDDPEVSEPPPAYDSRQYDEGPREAAPSAWSAPVDEATPYGPPLSEAGPEMPTSYNDPTSGGTISQPVPAPEPPSYTLVDGRTAPPSPGGTWEPLTNLTQPYDSRMADEGQRETGPAPWTPLSETAQPVTPPSTGLPPGRINTGRPFETGMLQGPADTAPPSPTMGSLIQNSRPGSIPELVDNSPAAQQAAITSARGSLPQQPAVRPQPTYRQAPAEESAAQIEADQSQGYAPTPPRWSLPGSSGRMLAEGVQESQRTGAAISPLTLYSAFSELPFDVYQAAYDRAVIAADRNISGTDPLAPFRGLGINLPSEEDVNPEKRPAAVVLAGLLMSGVLPDPGDPYVAAAFRGAGRAIGATGRRLAAEGRTLARGADAVADVAGRALNAGADAPVPSSLGSGFVADQGSTIGRGGAPMGSDALVFGDQRILENPRDPHIAQNVKKLAEAAGKSPADMTPDELYSVGLADAVVAHERARARIPAESGRRYYHVADPSYTEGEPLLSHAELRRQGREIPNKWEDDFPDYPKSPDARSVTFAESYAAAHAFNEDFLSGNGVILAVDVPRGARLRRNGEGYVMKPGSVPPEWVSRVDAAGTTAIEPPAQQAGSRALSNAGEAAARNVPAGESMLGSGMVPESGSRRFYHGTAGAFGPADPSKFDPDGLYGPGYYLTDSPVVANSYASERAIPYARDASWVQTHLRSIANQTRQTGAEGAEALARAYDAAAEAVPPGKTFTQDEINSLTSDAAFKAEGRIDFSDDRLWGPARAARDSLSDPTGANVRAVDVPSGVKLLDADRPLTTEELTAIRGTLTDPLDLRMFEAERARFDDPNDLAAVRAAMDAVAKGYRERSGNPWLARAGFDGISYGGGKNIPIRDDTGRPVEHQAIMIFPESLPRIRNAFSGEAGGSGFIPTMSDARNAAQGGVIGAASEGFTDEDLTPQERLARIGAGAALGVAAGRVARGGTRVPRAGSGLVPEQPSPRLTVEVLQERVGKVKSLLDDARARGDTELARDADAVLTDLRTQMFDAITERRRLEPNITSEVGRRMETLPPTESGLNAAESVRADGRGAARPDEMSGPMSVPTNMAGRQNAISAGIGAAGGGEVDEDGNVTYDPMRGGAMALTAGLGSSKAGRELAAKLTADANRIAAAAKAGPIHGARLNRPIAVEGSKVPLSVRLAQGITDDRAAMRWGENQLTDAVGSPRLPENSAARPSTQTRVNPDSVSAARIEDDLVTTVADAEREGLADELSQHLEDMHSFDVLVNVHQRAAQVVRDAAAATAETVAARAEAARVAGMERIQKLRDAGASPARIQAAEQQLEARVARLSGAARDVEAEAAAAGDRAMRQWAKESVNSTPEQIVERLEGQRQRLTESGKADRVTELAQRVWDHNRQTFQNAVDAGRMTADEAARLADEYPHYVPSQPISELLPDGTGGMTAGGPRAGKVSADMSNPVEAFDAAGSDRGRRGERLNPIIASRNATIVRERQAQQNRVFTRFFEMMGAATEESDALTPGSQGLRASRISGEVEVSGWVNGERQTVRVPKPIADMLNAAAQSGNPDIAMSFWGKVKQVVTETITSRRPAFFGVNLIRDFGDYAYKASAELGGPKALPRVVATYADELGRGIVDVVSSMAPRQALVGGAVSGLTGAAIGPEDQTPGERIARGLAYGVVGTGATGLAGRKIVPTGKAAEFLERGGGMGRENPGWKAGQQWFREAQRSGGIVARNPKELAAHVGDILKDLALFEPMAQIGNRAELVPRAARMRLAERAGENATEAMIRGRDATVDFARGGEIAKSWNKLIPFFNVTVQGGAQLVRTFRNHPAAASATMAATLGPLMLSTEVYNRATPERAQAYSDVPDYVKDSGVVLMLPWAGSDNRGERPNYLWIPTGLGTPFVQAARTAMSKVPGLEPVEGKGMTEAALGILTMFSPVKGENMSSIAATVVPPIAKQGIELGTNKSTFTGGQIASDSSDERASAFGQAIAGGVNRIGQAVGSDAMQEVRPSQVDYLARQLPAYGDAILGVSNDAAPTTARQSESRSIQNAPVIGQSAGRIIRDTGGANMERAREGMLTDGVREAITDAGMRPSDVSAVPSKYKGATLTREEQLRWQEVTNSLLDRKVSQATRSGAWRARGADREQIIRDAISEARDEAAARTLRRLNDAEIERRKKAS